MQFNRLGDVSVDELLTALSRGALTKLWYLGLDDNQYLTDAGLRVLNEGIAGGALPRLEFVTASGPSSSAAAAQALQDAFTRRPRPPR